MPCYPITASIQVATECDWSFGQLSLDRAAFTMSHGPIWGWLHDHDWVLSALGSVVSPGLFRDQDFSLVLGRKLSPPPQITWTLYVVRHNAGSPFSWA